jgi:hypothetical protein
MPALRTSSFGRLCPVVPETLASVDKASWIGLALSPDQQYLVYSVFDSAGRNLMLVDKFQ